MLNVLKIVSSVIQEFLQHPNLNLLFGSFSSLGLLWPHLVENHWFNIILQVLDVLSVVKAS